MRQRKREIIIATIVFIAIIVNYNCHCHSRFNFLGAVPVKKSPFIFPPFKFYEGGDDIAN